MSTEQKEWVETMHTKKRFKQRLAITMMILSGVCLTGLSVMMSVGADRL